MPYSAVKIANEFIAAAKAEGKELTPLQIIKLVYIAHGWGLPILGEKLLNEPVQAWQYGPVIPSLYYAIKQYRSNPVISPIQGDNDPQQLDIRHKTFIRNVYDRYKHLSGTQLSTLTHMEQTPWSKVWATHGRNAIISDELIAEHYKARLAAANADRS